LTLYEATGDRVGLMNTYVNMARMYRDSGNVAQAKINFEKCLAIVDSLPAYRDHPVAKNIRRDYQALSGGM